MRIISGYLKGKKINFLKNINTRPLKDAVKENIFNILTHSNCFNIKIEKSCVLDLYSGIGSFGIECISRGASKVTFIEKNIISYEVLQKNLSYLSITSKTTALNDKIENVLDKEINEKFNIFFFDPPFNDTSFYKNLELIKKKEIYKNNHIIVLHRENKSSDNLRSYLNIVTEKKYGRSRIIFAEFK